ncbi:MAG: hypothetical protein AAF490_28115 [Chloroflexota bacterium]
MKIQLKYKDQFNEHIELDGDMKVRAVTERFIKQLGVNKDHRLFKNGKGLAANQTLIKAGVVSGDKLELMSAGMGGTNV